MAGIANGTSNMELAVGFVTIGWTEVAVAAICRMGVALAAATDG